MKESTKDGFKFVGWIVGIIVVLLLCGWGAYAIKVAMSPVKGAGDTIIKDQGVTNRTQAQERFRDLLAAVKAADKAIDVAAAEVAAHPKDRIAQTNLTGAMQICNTAVEQYNAEASKVLSRNWLDGYPAEINDADPATDCKKSGE